MSPRIKICGITNLEDALNAAELGADAVGFVFYPKSPRNINPRTAGLISRELPPFVATIGVFVDEAPERVREIAAEASLGAVQLHGDESPEYCSNLGLRVIKAVRVRSQADIARLRSYNASAFLLDAYREGVPGGTGETFDWDLAIEAKDMGRLILSGGLNPANAAEAVRKVAPYGVDASSGVEERPGKKDIKKMKAFIEEVRKANG